jgi:hypothetical protein
VQWLFGKCKRRNKVQSAPNVPLQEQQGEESEDFEVVSEPQEANEVATQEVEEAEATQETIAEATQEVIDEAVQQEIQVQVTEVHMQGQRRGIAQREPPSSSTAGQREGGRKLYVTQYGEKYHLKRNCQGLQSYRSYEKEAAHCCLESSQRVLVFNRTQPTPQSETELSFGETTFYHHKGCTQFFGNRRNRPICIFCEDEERIMNYARNRTPATGSQNT